MNFDFSDDQKMLRDQARKMLNDRCQLSEVRRIFVDDDSYSKQSWQGLAELGAMGAAIPEAYQGAGLSTLELCVIAEELGRALAPVPFASSIYLAAEAIKIAGSEAQKKNWLPKLASGEAIGTFAIAESASTKGASSAPDKIQTSFDGSALSGVKKPVPDGISADIAIVAATTSSGLVLTLAELSGTKRTLVKTLDPTREHAQIQFERSPAEPLSSGPFDDGESLLNHLLDRAAILYAFEQLGGADAALDFACAYANQRYAFGRPIGSFQAIKHKLADAYILNQLARSNCYYAAMILADDSPDLPAAAAAARLAASKAFVYVAQENVQTHGGVGFTWESDCQFFYRRAKLLALTLGGQRRWEERLVSNLEKRNVA